MWGQYFSQGKQKGVVEIQEFRRELLFTIEY